MRESMNTTKLSPTHFRYWGRLERALLERAENFSDLFHIAMMVISMIDEDFEMVSGPISTGRVGAIDDNRRVFEKVIETLIRQNLNIFSQMPFEDKMVELYKAWHQANPAERYCLPILSDFYAPLFSSGKIRVLHFIHGWESSYGARWEHDNCPRWGIERKFLPKEFSEEALRTA